MCIVYHERGQWLVCGSVATDNCSSCSTELKHVGIQISNIQHSVDTRTYITTLPQPEQIHSFGASRLVETVFTGGWADCRGDNPSPADF